MFTKLIAAFQAFLARAKAIHKGEWPREYWLETDELGITFVEKGKRTIVEFQTIDEIWAQNYYDFLGNRIGYFLRTDGEVFSLAEGAEGFREAEKALSEAFGFNFEFYPVLDETKVWDLKIPLFLREQSDQSSANLKSL